MYLYTFWNVNSKFVHLSEHVEIGFNIGRANVTLQ